jgi:hypothetical protein
MGWFSSQSVRTRALVIQAVIIAGLIGFYKLALPQIQKARAQAAVEERERQIESFVPSVIVGAGAAERPGPPGSPEKSQPSQEASEKSGGETSGPSGSESGGKSLAEFGARPQRLRLTPEVAEVERQLGAPEQTMTDFRGGQHLTWIGTRLKLEASFNKGQLYALTITDLKTGHGEQVFESSALWRAF